jgi:hypothetical protein
VLGARTSGEITENVAMAAQPIPPEFWQALRHHGLVDRRAALPGSSA